MGNSESQNTTESQERPTHGNWLMDAVKEGDVHEVDSFLSKHRITPRCAYGLLQAAVSSNQLDMIKVFVKHGYELNVPPGENQPLLFTLTKEQTVRRYLLQNGADFPRETIRLA